MQSTLSDVQKECLLFIPQNPKLPIPWNQLTHLNSKARDEAIKGLVDAGLIDKRHALNMRGVCHLIVDCNMPFTEILRIYSGAFQNMSFEINKAKKILETDDSFNVYYYYTFRQYIEWDLFDSSHDFKNLDQMQAMKVILEVGLKLLDDGRVNHEKILLLLNMPAQMMKDHKISKHEVKQALEMYKGYL